MLIWSDGFDTLGGNDDNVTALLESQGYGITEENTGDPAQCLVSSNTVDDLGFSLNVNAASPGNSNGLVRYINPTTSIVVGVRVLRTGSASQNVLAFGGYNSLSEPVVMFRVFIGDNGCIGLSSYMGTAYTYTVEQTSAVDGLPLQSDPNLVFANTWQRLEVKFTMLGTITVRIDGTTAISGVTTPNPNTAANIQWVQFANDGNQSQRILIDDLVIMDQSGVAFDDFLGDVIVRDYMPDSDASPNQFTQFGGSSGHFTSVDEIPPDGDSSYLQDNVSGHKELFTLPTFDADVLDVLAVSVCVRARKNSAGFQLIAPALSVSSVEDDSIAVPATANLATSYQTFPFIYPTQPSGGAWTTMAAQSAVFGFRIP